VTADRDRSGEPLLHIVTAAPWRMALAAGSVVPPSLVADGFVHLSAASQVALPANRLFAGRDDLLLAVVDPARLPSPLRWEPGVPTDPSSMRFPHLYDPLPVDAVTSVVPWRPGADGAFIEPTGLPACDDPAARARAFDRSLAERRAAAVLPIAGGVAVLDPRFPSSWEHNGGWVADAGTVGIDTIVADLDRVLGGAGCAHRRVVLDDGGVATALADRGWEVNEERLMVLAPDEIVPPGPSPVRAVAGEAMHDLRSASWRRDIPGISDESVADLVGREAVADAVLRIVDLAVLGPDGAPIAGTQLRIDGATAAVEAVMTAPDARGHGHATSLVADAIRRARAAGCDVVWLLAAADDWPKTWYARLGFQEVATSWSAHTTPT